MPHPGILALLLGVAVGATLYAFFVNDDEEKKHSYAKRRNGTTGTTQHYDNSDNPARYRSRNNNDKGCTICLEPLKTNVISLPCAHTFHVHCIEPWFNTFTRSKKRPLCPLCRRVC